MSANAAPTEASGVPGERPRTIDLALYAIAARCVLAIAAALAAFGARDDFTRTAAKLHKDWSAAQLHSSVDDALRSNLLFAVIGVLLVGVLAWFIRAGRNWSRWVFAAASFLITRDIVAIGAFFGAGNVAFRILTGLTGLAALTALFLLFLRTSSEHFRPPGAVSVSPLRMLLGNRGALPATAPAGRVARPAAGGKRGAAVPPAGDPVPDSGPAVDAAPAVRENSPAGEQLSRPPRAKSRRPNDLSRRPGPRSRRPGADTRRPGAD